MILSLTFLSPIFLFTNRIVVVWKVTPLFAEWISSPDHNPLFAHGLLGPSSLVIELGCGISALVGLLLAPRISRMILTDQDYVAKLVEQNIAENEVNHDATHNPNKSPPPPLAKAARSSAAPSKGKARPPHPVPAPARHHRQGSQAPIHFSTLDWETDVPTSALTLSSPGESKSFDVVVACDCIYNEALIDPFVSTCADVCRLRSAEVEDDPGSSLEPCVCIVAQQLRDPDVFEAWLTRFAEPFDTYRVPDELLIEGLQSENSGFVVHLGVLKGAVPPRIQ